MHANSDVYIDNLLALYLTVFKQTCDCPSLCYSIHGSAACGYCTSLGKNVVCASDTDSIPLQRGQTTGIEVLSSGCHEGQFIATMIVLSRSDAAEHFCQSLGASCIMYDDVTLMVHDKGAGGAVASALLQPSGLLNTYMQRCHLKCIRKLWAEGWNFGCRESCEVWMRMGGGGSRACWSLLQGILWLAVWNVVDWRIN